MTTDNREHQRYQVLWEVEVSTGSWGDVLNLTTTSVSRGGLFIRSAEPPDEGTLLTVTLKLPDDTMARLQGRVVRRITDGAAGFGIQFDDAQTSDLVLLESMASAFGDPEGPNRGRHSIKAAVISRRVSTSDGSVDLFADTPTPSGQSPAVQAETPVSSPDELRPSELMERLTGDDNEAEFAPHSAAGEFFTQPTSDARDLLSELNNEDEAEGRQVRDVIQNDLRKAYLSDEIPKVPGPTSTQPVLSGVLPPVTERVDMEEADAFGVDLGTTQISIALRYGHHVVVFEDDQGRAGIPTVLCYNDPSFPLHGWEATEELSNSVDSCIQAPRRFLGRSIDDARIQEILAESPVRYQRGPAGQITALINSEPVSVLQACTELFKASAAVASHASLRRAERVVLTVPVGLSEAQRNAWRSAAKQAGLQVLDLIEEPIAAATAAGEVTGPDGVIAVFNLGGTFTFTLLAREAGALRTLHSVTDEDLGGRRFDSVLASHVAEVLSERHHMGIPESAEQWQTLVGLCEQAKLDLSAGDSATLNVDAMLPSLGEDADLEVVLTREFFLELTAELMEECVSTMTECFEATGLSNGQVTEVVLSGGLCRLAAVQDWISRYFQRDVTPKLDPQKLVVAGAAMVAHNLSGPYRDEDTF